MPSRDIIAFLGDGDVLLERGRLPVLREPQLQREVLDRVGAELFTGPRRRVAPEVFVHTVAGRTPARPEGEWIPVDHLTDMQASADELGAAVRSAVGTAAREHFGSAPVPPRRPEWYSPGWLDAVDAWIDAALAATGRRRVGEIVVTRMWSLSAIVRAATDSGTVYLKATGAGFSAEPTVTALLVKRYGGLLPTVLAAASGGAENPGRAWMLLDELRGVDYDQAPGAALALAPALADLQARTAGDLAELQAAGCPDRTQRSLLDGLSGLLNGSVELDRLSARELTDARDAAPRMAELVRELWDCGLPDTLTHGDLHLGNVAYDGRRVRIFDWTDAAVSHPFLDAVLLARSAAEEAEHTGAGCALDRDVADAYTARWRTHRPRADVRRALELAVPVNELYQAISYEAIYRNQEDASRWELEGVVERFLRRLPELVERAV